MVIPAWNDAAANVAVNLRRNRCSFRRGFIVIPSTATGGIVAWILANDAEGSDASARAESAGIRGQLACCGMEEMGFGVSPDGRSWALAVRAPDITARTRLGKAFHLEMIKAHLEETVQASWHATLSVSGDGVGWSIEKLQAAAT